MVLEEVELSVVLFVLLGAAGIVAPSVGIPKVGGRLQRKETARWPVINAAIFLVAGIAGIATGNLGPWFASAVILLNLTWLFASLNANRRAVR